MILKVEGLLSILDFLGFVNHGSSVKCKYHPKLFQRLTLQRNKYHAMRMTGD